MSPDDCKINLLSIRSDFKDFLNEHGHASETDTRIKLIDRILKEVLFWPEKSFSREDKIESGYSDYILKINGVNHLVIEAKKEKIDFKFPNSTNKYYKLNGVLLNCDNVKKSINQVRTYCDDMGIRYAVATNGEAWIIFRAIMEGDSWRKGSARVFRSIDDIIANFIEFWNLLSHESISRGFLESEFGHTSRKVRELHRPVSFLYNSDLPLDRNHLHSELTPIISKFFEDIADQVEIEILKKCYVYSKTLNIIANDLEVIFNDEIPQFLKKMKTVDVVTKITGNDNFDNFFVSNIDTDEQKLILLLGGIGCGKTTFLKRYQRYIGKEVLEQKTMWFYIDFLASPVNEQLFENYIYDEILKRLRKYYNSPFLETRQNIKRAYSKEIESLNHLELRNFKEGTTEYELALDKHIEKFKQDISTYVPRILYMAKPKKNRKVVIFIDNVDQLPLEYQQKIFLLSQHITRSIKAITIIALREESFFTAKIQNSFTAYVNKRFHIASPRFKYLIKNRIDYVLEVLNNNTPSSEIPEDIDTNSIIDYLNIVQSSIFENNKQIVRFIESLCYGNMRKALEWFANFLISGATDVNKMLRIYRRDKYYNVAFHEFVKSIMLGDKKYYKEGKSPILNVFDCGLEKNSSHFTSLRIIKLLLSHRSEYSDEGQGFYEISNLVSIFEDTFNNREDVIRSLNRLLKMQIIEVNSKSTLDICNASHCRVTSSGYYYYKYLVKEFSYLDLVLQDTPLNDHSISISLKDSIEKVDNMIDRDELKLTRMNERFSRVEMFLGYLEKEEEEEISIYNINKLESVFNERIVEYIKAFYYKQKDWIINRLSENREKYIDENELYDTKEDDFEDNNIVYDDNGGLIDLGER